MTNPIGALFGRSPIKPIQAHLSKAQACVEALGEFLDAAAAGEWGTASRIQDEIFLAESEADQIRDDIRLHLPNRYLLPVSRSDLLELVASQDSLAAPIKQLTVIILSRQMVFPQQVATQLSGIYESGRNASRLALKAINELDELLETGFSGKEAVRVTTILAELDAIESESDKLQTACYSKIFEIENDVSPTTAMFLYRLTDLLGDLADNSQLIGNRLMLMLAR